MPATRSATGSATAAAAVTDWLQVDKSAQIGPASYGQPGSPAPPVVPTAASPLPLPAPVTAPDAGDPFYDGNGAGAWPALPATGDGRVWLDRGDGFAQGTDEATEPQTRGAGYWNDTEPLQTYDYLSQNKDSAGWNQTVPNNRVSSRNTFGQLNPGNAPTWYGYGENAVQAHLAITAGPLTPDAPVDGTPGFLNGGLPVWDMSGGQGSTAYTAPAPPPFASAGAAAVPDPGARWA